MRRAGLPVQIVQMPGSLLTEKELNAGHRLAKAVTVKSWLKDIEDGLFVIERTPEINRPTSKSARRQSRKSRTNNTSQDPQSPLPDISEQEEGQELRILRRTEEGEATSDLAGSQHSSNLKTKNKKAKSEKKKKRNNLQILDSDSDELEGLERTHEWSPPDDNPPLDRSTVTSPNSVHGSTFERGQSSSSSLNHNRAPILDSGTQPRESKLKRKLKELALGHKHHGQEKKMKTKKKHPLPIDDFDTS